MGRPGTVLAAVAATAVVAGCGGGGDDDGGGRPAATAARAPAATSSSGAAAPTALTPTAYRPEASRLCRAARSDLGDIRQETFDVAGSALNFSDPEEVGRRLQAVVRKSAARWGRLGDDLDGLAEPTALRARATALHAVRDAREQVAATSPAGATPVETPASRAADAAEDRARDDLDRRGRALGVPRCGFGPA